MSLFIFANDASSTLAGPISSTATSVTLASGTGALFPNPGAGQQFALTFNDAATGLLTEIVYCTARATDTLTIARGQEGTIAQNWLAGDLAANLITAGQMNVMFQQGTYQGQQTTGRLFYSSATQLVFKPLGGNVLVIDGQIFAIPSSGITIGNSGVYVGGVSGQTLADNTVYDLFLFNNSGTVTADFWEISGGVGSLHMADTSAGNVGVEVRSNGGTPVSGESYIGKVATNSSGQFQTAGVGGLLSWFNKTQITVFGADIPGPSTISSTSGAEISVSGRIPFLTFVSQSMFTIITVGQLSASVAGSYVEVYAGLDGATIFSVLAPFRNANMEAIGGSSSAFGDIAEGQHFVTPCGLIQTSGNVGTVTDASGNVTILG